jgi:hypothetical protein
MSALIIVKRLNEESQVTEKFSIIGISWSLTYTIS